MKNIIKQFFSRTLIQPLLNFLRQGLTPEKLSLCVVLGFTLGTFPVLGSTTLLCTAAAFAFRLNLPAILLINYFAYPMQLLLFIPFIQAGELLFQQTHVPLDLSQIFSMLIADMPGTIKSLWWTNMRGVVAWFLFAVPVGISAYFVLVPVFSRLSSNEE